jgi:fructose-1,6-bisphosphatase I
MAVRGQTLSRFIIEELRRKGAHGGELAALLNDVQTACKYIDVAAARGALTPQERTAAADINIHGEIQTPLDLIANKIMVETCKWGGQLRGMISEELNDIYDISATRVSGRYLLLFDPLSGSANIDVNMTCGTIFGIIEATGCEEKLDTQAFLQPGSKLVAAGYAIYGPASMFVISLGDGVQGFTLDREIGAYTMTHPAMQVPKQTREFAINASNGKYWEPPIRKYVEECVEGSKGDRGADFNMRWVASVVAEVHRILIRGGVYMYPRDTRDPARSGRLRLIYEANPVAFLVEQAGGAASTGRQRILDVVPTQIHQRSAVVLGSQEEVSRIEQYHHSYDRGEDVQFQTPLFNTRSLFRTA